MNYNQTMLLNIFKIIKQSRKITSFVIKLIKNKLQSNFKIHTTNVNYSKTEFDTLDPNCTKMIKPEFRTGIPG